MPEPVYPDQSVFGYEASRRVLTPGEALGFDDSYRLAHLPLVAPDHPLGIDRVPGRDYVRGTYEQERFSLVAPIPWEVLTAAEAYGDFADDLISSVFQRKISSEITRRRSDRLHATIAGGLEEEQLEKIVYSVTGFMHDHGPVRIRVLGPFVGRKNTGRIYLPVVPETIDGGQAFGKLQSEIGLPVTGFYAIGLFNLAEELTVSETRELADLQARWKDRVLLETSLERLRILGTHDDLVLSGRWVS